MINLEISNYSILLNILDKNYEDDVYGDEIYR